MVADLYAGRRTWRTLDIPDRRIIALAAIKELNERGDELTIEQFEYKKPSWMPKATTLAATFSLSWRQLLKAANEPF